MDFIKLHFEDKGQDFLTWEIDTDNGKVVHCEPLQSPIWVNTIVTNLDDIIKGKTKEVNCEWPESGSGKLSYKVKKITTDQDLQKDLRFLRELEIRTIFNDDSLTLIRDWQNEIRKNLKLPNNFQFVVIDAAGVPVHDASTLIDVYNYLTSNLDSIEKDLTVCDLQAAVRVSELDFLETYKKFLTPPTDLTDF